MLNEAHPKPESTKNIAIISFISLLLGHLMINTYVTNEALNFIGLLVVSYFIYYNTLQKNNYFAFIIVIYFCSSFPYLGSKGGAFNLVSLCCLIFYYLSRRKFPGEIKIKDWLTKLLIILLLISSFLGWIFNYTGDRMELIYSISTFLGIISILILSGRLVITPERVKVFLQINFILIIYSILASINKYVNIVTFSTPMMPIYGSENSEYFEGGGIIGSSPLYGEHSMILFILFLVFLILGQKHFVKSHLLLTGAIISLINIFMSISRSVFLLSIVGIIIIYILQFRLIKINFPKVISQIVLIIIFVFGSLWIVEKAGLNYVFERVDEIEKVNKAEGGITLDRILDGSAFNRSTAFHEAFKRYDSKESWLIGYGWGIGRNNRDAYYVDPNISRGSAHSQIFAVLFILGWVGFIAYFGLIFRIIFKSYKTLRKINIAYVNRLMAFFFFIAISLFFINEIKADSISIPSYFAVTIIWMGLAISINNQNIKENQSKVSIKFGKTG